MNYSNAVRGCRLRSGKLNTVLSAAETELGRQISKEEISLLTNKFSVDVLHSSLEKVPNNLPINFLIQLK